MINENIYRSPKWLRNFLDFEINTGDDIKGEPSKKAIEKEKSRKIKDYLKKWDKQWYQIYNNEKLEFSKFFIQSRFNTYNKSYLYEYEDDYKSIIRMNRGSFAIFDEYNEWKIAKKEKEQEQERIKKELDDLFKLIIFDFSNNPYQDKYYVFQKNGKNGFNYTFENNDVFTICDNKIEYGNITYKLGLLYQQKFFSLCNEIGSKGRKRPNSEKEKNSKSHKSTKSSQKKYDDPNRNRYEKLKDNIKLRQEQLNKLDKNDPDYDSLNNELNAHKKMANKIKNQYKFENLISYYEYSKI